MSAVPDDFLERARALAAGTLQPAPTRDAATVVLLRDSPRGVEAYLLRRVKSMAFAGGMHVFPGGSVDPRDLEHKVPWQGSAPTQWGSVLSADDQLATALVCAAVRETFEESGVLLASRADGGILDVTDADLESDRQALVARTLSFSDLLANRQLVLRTDLLRPWAHWITPEFEPRRFDTRFFIAAVPEGQQARDVGGEADAALWLAVDDALDRNARGELGMLPPTIFTLSEIASYEKVDDVLAAAARRDVRPVLPKVVVTGDEVQFLLPGDEGYPR